MKLTKNTSLLPYNTFGLPARTAFFAEIASVEEFRRNLHDAPRPLLILGGGSNILFTKDWPGTVIRNKIRGIEIVRQFKNRAWVRIGGGENWHRFVEWAVRHNLGGVENLSLIPGAVGAAPVQNIGAYGVELRDVFIGLHAIDLETGQMLYFSRTACRFGYRDSVFKKEAKDRYCITSVTLSLTTRHHRLNTQYGDIRKILEARGVQQPTIADISQAVIDIRSSKLPDPAQIGNCGSFFKNPEVEKHTLEHIRKSHPAVPHYELPNDRVKIPAGWLIEQCGWKGKRVGNTGSYARQALVLVNYGGATGAEVAALAAAIIKSVEKSFGIRLEAEVNIL